MNQKYKNFTYLNYLSKIDLLNKYNINSLFLIPKVNKITVAIENNFSFLNNDAESNALEIFYYFFFTPPHTRFKRISKSFSIKDRNNKDKFSFKTLPEIRIFSSNFKYHLNLFSFKNGGYKKKMILTYKKQNSFVIFKLKIPLFYLFKPFSSGRQKFNSKDYNVVLKFYIKVCKNFLVFSKAELINFFYNCLLCWKFKIL